MDQQRERIQEDLRGLLAGEVRCDDVFTHLYASDASIHQVRPLGVVRPRNAADVVALVRYAAENQLPLHARGAGTGLAGESLGAGLVIDFATYMRRIIDIGPDFVRVQPGVVLERLNHHLKPLGRVFGPDPAMSHVTTMGSVVAIDAAGSHWLEYGSARRNVRSLQLALANGSLIEAGREPIVGGISADPLPERRELINRLSEVLFRYQEVIRRSQPKSLVNTCGYRVADILGEDSFDLAGLMVGSEGTLALFTEMTLATRELPKKQGMALLFFDRLENAAHAVGEILPLRPATCDLMDRRHLSLARESDQRYNQILPQMTEALLLVESHGEDVAEVRDKLRDLVEAVRRRRRLAFDARQTLSPDEMHLYWQLARKVVPTLYRLKGSTRALPFVEDMAVPPEELAKFLVEMQNILKRHQVTATLFAHAGHGQLHLRPFLDLDNPDHVRTLDALTNDLYEAVWSRGGTISGEHGDGLSRTPFVQKQYGELQAAFREIKRAFDPAGILNPGKIVSMDPDAHVRNLRASIPVAPLPESPPPEADAAAAEPPTPNPLGALQLHWGTGELAATVRGCNGCGACRDQGSATRMCPIFRFSPSEEASPRAKANLLSGILTGQLDPKEVAGDEFKAVADLCVNCQMCRVECPAGVDIPRLMLEAKAAYVAANGLRFRDWALTRLDLFGKLGSLASPLVNWAIGNRQARWLMEKLTGVAQARKLPRFAARAFIRRASRRRLTRPVRQSGKKVLYFVDTYANYHDPQLAEALTVVLEHSGVAVYVHPEQTQSGMAMVSIGAVAQARKVARKNVELLAEAVRQGYTIVASEPSAVLCLTREYPALLDDDDTRLVAANTKEACAYLWELHLSGKLQIDLKPVTASIGYHWPCHMKALGQGSPGANLLGLIPGLSLHRVEKGCSGMAGTFGLRQENYRASLRAGWPLISAVREATWQAGATECSACKIQMEQGSSKPTIHPLKLLAHSYGLAPEVGRLLTARGRELIVT